MDQAAAHAFVDQWVRDQRGGLVCEVLTFDGGLVVEGHGTYLEP
jgi:hypothetical protein